MRKGKQKSKQNREMFSIAKGYSDIIPFLETLPNKSGYICQAICEKMKNDSEKAEGTSKALEDTVKSLVEMEVKGIIDNLLKDDYFLVKANTETLQGSQLTIPPAVIEEPTNNNLEKEKDEEFDLIQQITDAW